MEVEQTFIRVDLLTVRITKGVNVMSITQRFPLPWRESADGIGIVDANGVELDTANESDTVELKAYMLRAVNAHETLVKYLSVIIEFFRLGNYRGASEKFLQDCEKVLAESEVK